MGEMPETWEGMGRDAAEAAFGDHVRCVDARFAATLVRGTCHAVEHVTDEALVRFDDEELAGAAMMAMMARALDYVMAIMARCPLADETGRVMEGDERYDAIARVLRRRFEVEVEQGGGTPVDEVVDKLGETVCAHLASLRADREHGAMAGAAGSA